MTTPTTTRAVMMTSEGPKNPCTCGHGRRSHEVDYSNYPQRVEHGKCRVKGCPCTKYERRGE
ncbi:MAG: FAM221A/B family protein [Euryarchaeota archaeon]|nr:FAM221A/B family protein [Euryarchaeota archaeon]MDE2044475.1 FAM221A/B family protein [Thermoplasmata archaeon]